MSVQDNESMSPAASGSHSTEPYKHDVDRSTLRENLKLSVEDRFIKFERFMELVGELRKAGQASRNKV